MTSRLLFEFLFLALPLTFFSVVMPNSFPYLNVIALALASVIVAIRGSLQISRLLLVSLAVSSFTTVLYMTVGAARGAPGIAIAQTTVVYILTPILWSIVVSFFLSRFGALAISRWLAWCLVPIAISVALYFFLFITFGPSSVSVFIEVANIQIGDGTVAATMHVFGSLIFICGGMFAAPGVIRNVVVRLFLMLIAVVLAMVSGRGALVAALIFGVLIRVVTSTLANPTISPRRVIGLIVSVIVLLVSLPILQSYFLFDVTIVFNDLVDKISGESKAERGMQAAALLDGFFESNGLGAGHGSGVSLIRNELYPWRYETVWVATLFRVGLVGTLLYAAPFIACFCILFYRAVKDGGKLEARFLLGGFTAAFIASNTNPYLEGFALQWMFVIPVVYSLNSRIFKVQFANQKYKIAGH